MNNNITFKKDQNCLYMVQDLQGLDEYERITTTDNFVKKETKLFERMIDTEIVKIFQANGIKIYSTDKSVLNRAFDTLKQKGKLISITDIYEKDKIFGCVKVCESNRTCMFNVWLEDDRYLQVGVLIEVIRL